MVAGGGRPTLSLVAGMTLTESGRRLGGVVWVERRLFETLGAWVRIVADPALSIALATQARHHAAHAQSLEALLPETRDHDPEAFVSAPTEPTPSRPPMAEVLRRLVGPTAIDAGSDEIATLLEVVLPAQVGALDAWVADASPVRDAPGIRGVTAILVEHRADRDRLAALVGGLGPSGR